jgi:hypothetical protein
MLIVILLSLCSVSYCWVSLSFCMQVWFCCELYNHLSFCSVSFSLRHSDQCCCTECQSAECRCAFPSTTATLGRGFQQADQVEIIIFYIFNFSDPGRQITFHSYQELAGCVVRGPTEERTKLIFQIVPKDSANKVSPGHGVNPWWPNQNA